MKAIVEFEFIADFVQKLRKNSKLTIAFTNGCFDILHRGHVELLEKAKEYADYLVVGLNSDVSVKRLKGMERPYMGQEDRAFILSRLEAVDVVCIFEQDTPLELIKQVQPDYLIKGGDYKVEQIVGKEIVEARGGKVLTIPLVAGRSTTSILQKLRS
ncbi:MAG TPA: D-glycero-beta-D-manno-heptose 1-phosphate adenylyltransferase [Calditrichaeota bacterium]|nr:D-glycero-beta-D-manno-heptose 1-phosphate adenylyltransferase [Calditrichota bacterium]